MTQVQSFRAKARSVLKQIPPLRWARSFAQLKYYQMRRNQRFGKHRVTTAPLQQIEWAQALEQELNFWRWSLGKGHFRDRLDPNRHLQGELGRLLKRCVDHGEEAIVIDVGSGPLTTLGPVWHRPMRLMAIDTLANEYNMVMDELGIEPPVRPIKGSAEDLLEIVPQQSAHLLVMNNALDHSFQPLQCIRNLVDAAKPGCFVYLSHFANEAERENYAGLHQWNIFRRGTDTIVASTSEEYSVAELLGSGASVNTTTKLEKQGIVETIIHKHT